MYTPTPPHTIHSHPLTHSPYHTTHSSPTYHHTHHTLTHSPHTTHSLTTLPHTTHSLTQAILNPLQGFFNAIAYGGICQIFCSWLCTKLKRKDPYVSSWSGEYIDVDFRVSRGRIHCSRRKISTWCCHGNLPTKPLVPSCYKKDHHVLTIISISFVYFFNPPSIIDCDYRFMFCGDYILWIFTANETLPISFYFYCKLKFCIVHNKPMKWLQIIYAVAVV